MFQVALEFLNSEVKPNAHLIDTDVQAMNAAFKAMKSRGLLALRRSSEFGPNLSESEFRRFQEEIARVSGALAFLQTQHQSAVSLINKHATPDIRSRLLPLMHNEHTVGLGFSQLRRLGQPLCTAEKVENGYLLKGHVPWVTGFGFFDDYLVGASLSDGRALFGLIPFHQADGQSISLPMKLTAMEACQTVTIDLQGYFLPDSNVAFIKDPGWMRANDAFNITLQGHFAIGCAMAGIDILRDNAKLRKLGELNEYAYEFSKEIDDCRAALVNSQTDFSDQTAPERLRHRAWSIELMMRCAHAAVVSSSGAANFAEHPAGRVLREAIVFSVSAQTQPILLATLDRLAFDS